MTSSLLSARIGSPTARVSHWPPYPATAAPEVIELAELTGLILDDWQKEVLTHILGQELDGSWTAKKVSLWVPRQNGKGAILEALELGWLFLFGEPTIVHSAHEHKTATKAYRRLEKLIRNTPVLHRLVKQYRRTNGEQQIELWDGRTLEYSTRSTTATRGFSTGKLVVDEAQEYTADQNAAIMPTVSAMPNWQIIFTGTPPDDPAAWCYGLKKDGEARARRLAHFDWGADVDLADPAAVAAAIADRDTWYATNPALGGRILEETVEDESTSSGLGDKFLAERLGVWLPPAIEGGGSISEQAWGALADPKSRRSKAEGIAVGIDTNPGRTNTSVGAWGRREDGRGHAELVEYRPGNAWVVARCVELRDKHHPFAFALDPKSATGSLIDDLEAAGITRPDDPDEPHRGHLWLPTTAELADSCGQLLDAVANQAFHHLGDVGRQGQLARAALGAKPRPLGDGAIAFGRRISSVDISPLVAITLARRAFELFHEDDEYDVLDSIG